MFNILIIGCGMLGGSLAKLIYFRRDELSEYLNSEEIIINAYDRNPVMSKIFDDYFTSLSAALETRPNMIIIAVHLDLYQGIFADLVKYKENLKNCRVITDISSVKSCLFGLGAMLGEELVCKFIPAHPIGGSHKSGFVNADHNMLLGRPYIITPFDFCDKERVTWMYGFLSALNVLPSIMSPNEHDQIYGEVSHFVQYIAFKLHDFCIVKGFDFSASEFAEFVRLFGSNIKMWMPIFAANCEVIRSQSEKFIRFTETCDDYQESGAFDLGIFFRMCSIGILNITSPESLKFRGSGFDSITSLIDKENVCANRATIDVLREFGKSLTW